MDLKLLSSISPLGEPGPTPIIAARQRTLSDPPLPGFYTSSCGYCESNQRKAKLQEDKRKRALQAKKAHEVQQISVCDADPQSANSTAV